MPPNATERVLAEALYRGDRQGMVDRLRLALSGARSRAVNDDKALMEAAGYARLLKFTQAWEKPVFPLKGTDLLAIGMAKGPAVGTMLKTLEKEWIAAGFKGERGALLERAAQLKTGSGGDRAD